MVKGLTGSIDKTARLWDVATGKELSRLEHPNNVGSVPSKRKEKIRKHINEMAPIHKVV
ncbi:hypothetical protein H0W26_02305 [Candidatus Dependentiae bacterium]|nr:hypothetical protein [Candidatus Dependentiae bacterium]